MVLLPRPLLATWCRVCRAQALPAAAGSGPEHPAADVAAASLCSLPRETTGPVCPQWSRGAGIVEKSGYTHISQENFVVKGRTPSHSMVNSLKSTLKKERIQAALQATKPFTD